jgi:hypothetical protein
MDVESLSHNKRILYVHKKDEMTTHLRCYDDATFGCYDAKLGSHGCASREIVMRCFFYADFVAFC